MTVSDATPRGETRSAHGLTPSRRVVIRWAWRLFRREWRQQVLIVALVIVAVAAAVIGVAVAINTPAPAASGFGTALDAATFSGSDPHLGTQIASLERRFGRVDVIENETVSIPGSIDTYQLRGQDPQGPFGQPMLTLVSGRFPTSPSQVAVTAGVAADFNLKIGEVWQKSPGTLARRVVGIVENPQNLLDEFALVVPGQVKAPTQVTELFDAPGVPPSTIGPNVLTPSSQANTNSLNPETISLAVLSIAMMLIALVAVGGFTVLAQRRLRSLGMLASIGASDERVGLVVRANGIVVGAVGAFVGAVLGLVLWLAYRPHLEQSAHHLIGVFALPWVVVGAAIVLALVATYVAAARPARSLKKVSIVAALSGRPAPPKQARRSALPGIALLVIAFVLLGYAGSTDNGTGNAGTPELVLGLVALIPTVIFFAPSLLALLGHLGGRAPVAVRIALRDLARYRARSGSVLAAISLGIMIAVIVAVLGAARYGDVFDYAAPNLASNQLVVYAHAGRQSEPATTADAIGSALGARHVIGLETTTAYLDHPSPPFEAFGGSALHVATPQLLRAFGISASQVDPMADILTSRPGFSGISGIYLTWCTAVQPPSQSHNRGLRSGTPINPLCSNPGVLKDPVIQEVSALPSGTSAPNIVLTEHAIRTLGIESNVKTRGWLIEAPHALTAAQIQGAQTTAAAAGMTIEAKNDQPTSAEVIDLATVVGIALALCILAMSVGLIRSETASDLRTLTATGASRRTRRALTATTAGALGVTGAVLGTAVGYAGAVGWMVDHTSDNGLAPLGNVPVANLLVILIAMPLLATAAGWLFAGRQPPTLARQPIE
jgi:putative ABC transport system permease protein